MPVETSKISCESVSSVSPKNVGEYVRVQESTPFCMSEPVFVTLVDPSVVGADVMAVDLYLRKKHARAGLTEDQLVAEGDKSGGVLMASGYIAGGAIAGILIAVIAGLADPNGSGIPLALAGFNKAINTMAAANPFVSGERADLLSLLPFAVLIALLYLTGRDVLLARRRAKR